MSGSLLDAGAVTTPSGGLRIRGAAVATTAHTYVVAGCPHTVDGVPSPCVTVRWTAAATGVTADGVPVLLDTCAAQCFSAALVPQGPPVVQAVQRKVTVR